jgi:ribosomal protein S18 acetylase RimI-like enzyme
MNNDDILYLSDLNLAEFVREMARWNAESEIIEHNDLLITKSLDQFPVTNVAVRLHRCAEPPCDEAIYRVKSFYRKYNSSFSIHIRRHADADMESVCKSEKMIKVWDNPGMMIEASIPVKALSGEIEIRQVKKSTEAADFASVAIESYKSLGMSADVGSKIFATPDRIIRPYSYLVVGYLRGIPVSSAMVLFSHSIAGIYWVGTIQNARRRGIAEACVGTVTNEAFRRGAAFVVLQASKFGEPIYRRMGFKEFTQYPWYMFFHKS